MEPTMYLTCTEPLLYRLMISSQLPAHALTLAAPQPLHKSTRPKELLGLSPSPLSHHIVDIFLVGIAFQEIPSVHTTARLRPLPAERISPLLKGETTTCKTSSSLFELFVHTSDPSHHKL
ncbi:hypothetical protein D0861_07218 [Hortaea werneckii]|uniref:Uncharacterized protein n=1 Tax=Hortaea werneckii TaxID=91943 RepID=A0A3M7F4V4_HORWE|nr:hypothetical protein D0861_07218 [Hortaea werneckii]